MSAEEILKETAIAMQNDNPGSLKSQPSIFSSLASVPNSKLLIPLICLFVVACEEELVEPEEASWKEVVILLDVPQNGFAK